MDIRRSQAEIARRRVDDAEDPRRFDDQEESA
jgi:hypothetical protein